MLRSHYACCLGKGVMTPQLKPTLNLILRMVFTVQNGQSGPRVADGNRHGHGQKKMNKPGKIYVLISDGECQEGTTWESLLIGARHKLDNLVVLIDYNKIQALTTLDEALPLGDLAAKFEAFNWSCSEISNGHSFEELIPVFQEENVGNKPRAIITHTVKGKGIKAFENDPAWHARKVKGEELEIGKKELGLE